MLAYGGTDSTANLALACPEFNFHKGTNLTGIDPDTGKVTHVFNPRKERWEDHFAIDGVRVKGKTAMGRTTVWLLRMNDSDRLRWRKLWLRLR